MRNFRKKPCIVEAEQWFPDKEVEGVITKTEDSAAFIASNIEGVFEKVGFIETLEGKMIVRSGDWVIKGVKGELYPCRNDIFKETYEPMEGE